jgi:hypothetical protein
MARGYDPALWESFCMALVSAAALTCGSATTAAAHKDIDHQQGVEEAPRAGVVARRDRGFQSAVGLAN